MFLKYVIVSFLCRPPRNVLIDLKMFIFVYVSQWHGMRYGPIKLCKLFQISVFKYTPATTPGVQRTATVQLLQNWQSNTA